MLWLNILVLLYIHILAVVATGNPVPEDPEEPPTEPTIIDILSANVEYLYFLRHLQRNGLIPLINLLENVTLLAPVNLAFAKATQGAASGSFLFKWDNNELTRYVVDQVMVTSDLGNNSVVFNTLYHNSDNSNRKYPLLVSYNEGQGYVIDQESTIVEPDISALHQGLYVQGIDQLLLLKPGICEFLLSDDSPEVNGHSISFVKACFLLLFPSEVSKTNDDDVAGTEITTEGKKNGKKKNNNNKNQSTVLPRTCSDFMNKTKTLFLPSDKYVHSYLLPLQIDYYASLYQNSKYKVTPEAVLETQYDILNLLENLMVKDLVAGVNGTIAHSSGPKSKAGISHISINGEVTYSVTAKLNSRKMCLDNKQDSIQEFSNIVLSDGAIHVFGVENGDTADVQVSSVEQNKHLNRAPFFSSHKVPVSMIARKALFANHYSNVVEEYYFRNLEGILDGSTANQTIVLNLEDRDDAPDDEAGVTINSFSSKQELMYQVLDSPHPAGESEVSDSVTSGAKFLVNTKLCSKKRIGKCFKSKIWVTDSGKVVLNDVEVDNSVLIANNSRLYFIDGENTAPENLKHSLFELISSGDAVSPDLSIVSGSCLDIFQDLKLTELISLDDNNKGYTLFLPCGKIKRAKYEDVSPWDSLGLILNHFKRNPQILTQVLQGIFIEGTLYSDFHGRGKFKTLNKETLIIESLPSVDDHVLIINDSVRIPMPLNSDILFNQGVVHITNELMLPKDLTITMRDLIKTTFDADDESSSFLQLIELYPKLYQKITGSSNNFSLLIPTAASLDSFNITSNFEKLFEFIEFHLIPNTELEKMLTCIAEPVALNLSSVIRTNYTNTSLNCRKQSSKTYLRLNPYNEASVLNKRKMDLKTLIFQNLGFGSFFHRPDPEVDALGYNKDHEVRVLNQGCTRGVEGYGCVFLIDKPLSLGWLEKPKGNFLHVSLGIVSLGIGIICGLFLFGAVMLAVLMCMNKKHKQIGGHMGNGVTEFLDGGRPEPSYMSVRDSSDDNAYDRGYETDDDMLRSEHEHLLPTYEKRKKRGRTLGSASASLPTAYAGSVGTTNDHSPTNTNNDNNNNTLAPYERAFGGRHGYGSTRDSSRSPNGPTGPLPINGNSIINTLNRERNLPSVA